jgi:hypothetical protein
MSGMNRETAERLVDALLETAIARGIYAAGGDVSNMSLDEVHAKIKASKKELMETLTAAPEHAEGFKTVHDGYVQAALTGILTHGASYGHIDGKGDDERLCDLALAYADTMMAMRAARKEGAK